MEHFGTDKFESRGVDEDSLSRDYFVLVWSEDWSGCKVNTCILSPSGKCKRICEGLRKSEDKGSL